jgi:DNA-binding MarR family transcriptional regulator
MSIPPLPEGVPPSRVNQVANGLHSAAIHLLRNARLADLETGLTPERLSLLSVLVYAGPQSLGRLAEIEQVSRPAISRMATALSQAGLIRTERSKSDRRSVTASATREGRELMEAGRRGRLERIAAVLDGLEVDELDVLTRAATILDQAVTAS